MTEHAIIHSPEGGRDGMSDDAFMWGMWLGRGDSCEQRRQQQKATDTTAGSNRYYNREQPILQQGATERKAGGRMSFLKKS